MRPETAAKLVILDRDGTISVDREDFVKSPDEWEPLPGALEAVARLHRDGWIVALATNQSGIGRGLFDMSTLNAIHAKMNAALARLGGRVDAIFFCPHAPDELCNCRKPLPGLIEQIGARFGVPLKNVPVVGDSLRDLQAAAAAGAEPHLVLTGKAAVLDAADIANVLQQVPGTQVHDNLTAFSEFIMRRAAKDKQPLHDFSDFSNLD